MDKIRRIMKLAHVPSDYYADYTELMTNSSTSVDLSEYNEELKTYDIIYAITTPMYDYDDEDAIIVAHIIMDVITKFNLQYLIPEKINYNIRSVLSVAFVGKA